MRRKRIMRLSLQGLGDQLLLPEDVKIVAMTQMPDDFCSQQVLLMLESERFSPVDEGCMIPKVDAVYRDTVGVPEFVEFTGG